jgi:rhamnosyltransferase subunit B
MHVVISGWGSSGDVMPLIAVGSALRQRGHQVHFAGNPHFQLPATEAGLSFLGVGATGDHERLMADTGVFGPNRKTWEQIYADHYFPRMDAYHRTVAAAIRPGTVIIGDEVGAAAVAEQQALPRVLVAPSSPRFASRYDPPHPEQILPVWAAWSARTGLGLALYYRLRNLRRGIVRWPVRSEWLPPDHPVTVFRSRLGLPLVPPRAARLTLCLWPEWFAAPQADWPRGAVVTGFPMYPRPVRANRQTPDASSAGSRSGPIVATTGSVAGSQARFFATVVDACRTLGRPAILVSPHADHIPSDLPSGVRHVLHAPFNELLGSASLVIHHGGIGTAAYALGAGVPQIVMPMRGDQFDNGNRLARLGVARMISIDRTGSERLARMIEALSSSQRVASQCRYWQSRLDPDEGLRRAADFIEALGDAGRSSQTLSIARAGIDGDS